MPPRPRRSLLWLLACGWLQGSAANPRKKGNSTYNKVLMQHHSFVAPLEHISLLDDWTVSGASVFERERLLLHPDVSERFGFAWNKAPLLTNNFEVVFHFKVVGERDGSKVPSDQGLAFWYVAENVSAAFNESHAIKASSWTEGMKEQGFTLLGSKATFAGFGAVLSMADPAKPKPTVSFVSNDGRQPLALSADVLQKSAKAIDFRNTLNAAQLKIRVQANEVEAHLKLSPSLSWNQCFKVDRSKAPITAGGYIGFTAWSGSAADGMRSDLVSIIQVDVTNYDDTTIGEEMKDVTASIQDAYKEMLLDQNRHFADQRAQKDHLNRLAAMLQEHIRDMRPLEERLFSEVEGLQTRVGRLGEECRSLTAELRLIVGSGESQDGKGAHQKHVEAMKNDIIGLRRLLVKDSASHLQKLEAVSKNVAEVKEKSQAGHGEMLRVIAQQAESLEKTVQTRGFQLSWMMLCMMAAVLTIGGLMWNRMRYYEKKHFI